MTKSGCPKQAGPIHVFGKTSFHCGDWGQELYLLREPFTQQIQAATKKPAQGRLLKAGDAVHLIRLRSS